MASKRRLKKDIDFVVNELVIECFTYNYLFPEKNKDKLADLIAEAIVTGEQFRKQVSAVKHSKENPAKKQYKLIKTELVKKADEFVTTLSKFEQ